MPRPRGGAGLLRDRRPVLVIFVKQPLPGRVKTRLARDIGTVEAVWWFRHQSAAVIRRLSADHRWRTVLAVTPDATGLRSCALPVHLSRAGQGRGNLGRRMVRFLRREPGTGLPAVPVAIIGADIPALAPRHVAEAFRLLGRRELVLGPATDGGYWLIGCSAMARMQPDVLAGVRWSSEHALADTLARLDGMSVGFASTLSDVDRAADLRLIGHRKAAGTGGVSPS